MDHKGAIFVFCIAVPVLAYSSPAHAGCETINGSGTNGIAGDSLCASILGGQYNGIANAWDAVIVAGDLNTITNFDSYSFIGAGVGNSILGSGNSPPTDGAEGPGGNVIVGGNVNTLGQFAQTGYSFIGGGKMNGADSFFVTLVGGMQNTISPGSTNAFLGGGLTNTVTNSPSSMLAGGSLNQITNAQFAVLAGGFQNRLAADFSVISGGAGNMCTGGGSVIAGGSSNHVEGHQCGVFSGSFNTIDLRQMTSIIGGGVSNIIGAPPGTPREGFMTGDVHVIGGGLANNIFGGDACFIGGGHKNVILLDEGLFGATIAGGEKNVITGNTFPGVPFPGPDHSFIGGGEGNGITTMDLGGNAPDHAVIGGGQGNQIQELGEFATIGGGLMNFVNAPDATVAGGEANAALGQGSTVLGGVDNAAVGDLSVAGGRRSIAEGFQSVALGGNARALMDGCFVFSDAAVTSGTQCTAANQFVVRASGGVTFFTAPDDTAGITMGAGGMAFAPVSDRNRKHGFAAVDPQEILEKLLRVPVTTWRYNKEVSGALHMGPMAQDFYVQFELGDDDKHIGTVDADGVQIAAIQGLYAIVQDQGAELRTAHVENEKLRSKVDTLEARLARLEAMLEK